MHYQGSWSDPAVLAVQLKVLFAKRFLCPVKGNQIPTIPKPGGRGIVVLSSVLKDVLTHSAEYSVCTNDSIELLGHPV